MVKPKFLKSRPAWILSVLGGLVGMLLFSALLYLAPTAGFPLIDIPRLIGGVFSRDVGAAFWLGYGIVFLGGVFVVPPLVAFAWPALPGGSVGFGGALLKGPTIGVMLWALTGVLLPVLGAINLIDGLSNPGLLGFGLGMLGGIGLFIAFLAYSVALAVLAAMGQGIKPIDTVGWVGYRHAETEQTVLSAFRNGGRFLPPQVGGTDTGKRV